MQIRFLRLSVIVPLGWLLVAGCSDKSREAGATAENSARSDPDSLPLNLADQLVALKVRSESPGRVDTEILRGLETTPLERLNPREVEDSREWSSERRSREVVDALQKLFSSNEPGILAGDFVCSELRPHVLEAVEYYGGFRVLRAKNGRIQERDYEAWEGFTTVRASLLGEDS